MSKTLKRDSNIDIQPILADPQKPKKLPNGLRFQSLKGV